MGKYVPAPRPRDPNKGAVYVAGRLGRIPPKLDAYIGDARIHRVALAVDDELPDSAKTRFLVTTGQVSRLLYFQAGRLRADLVCLPNAGDYLTGKIAAAVDKGDDVLLVVNGAR